MLGLLNHAKVLVGYDLGHDCAQISYAFAEEGEAETLSYVAGEQKFNIPAALCKRPGVNQWFFGKEALRFAAEEDGILVEDLLGIALDGEPIQIEGEGYEPVSLLTLFVKRTLGLLSQAISADKIYGMVISCETMDEAHLDVLSKMVEGLRLKTERIYFQSHQECYYDYMLRQPEELWTEQSLLFDYRGERILAYHLECSRRTTPKVVFIEGREYPFFSWESLPETQELRTQRLERLDREFSQIAEDACKNRSVSSVYLIGEHFSDQWMKESLKILCRGRRVFQGSNLYSKGACYGLQERLKVSEAGKSHVFLGNDKLRANVGMKLLRQGEEVYVAVLDAGVNWFEARRQMDFYIQDGNCPELMITPLMGKGAKLARIVLEDLPEGLTRLRARFYMTDKNRMAVEIRDLGLGELRASSEHKWKEELIIY